MPLTPMPAGLVLDRPVLAPSAYWRWGTNVRVRQGLMETIGHFGPLRNAAGAHHQLPGSDIYRSIIATPNPTEGQILAASTNRVMALYYDPASIPGTGTRWLSADVTPGSLSNVSDVVSDPGVGRIEIPPVWWWADQEDLVVGGRSNAIADPVYVWDRGNTTALTALANSPTGAVGGGIIGRILVLLGCTSFTDPDPQRFMTIRWSNRYDFEDWTPSDVNVSGELQLEGGSRIMGGGVVGKGVIAWTDKRMALLTETGDPDSVFARRYIDGGRGLMANNAWCEADGQVWWFDETRTLNLWDGGAPRQIPNPLRSGTVERLLDRSIARAYLQPNQEFNEIILWYPTGNNDINDQALVYNYGEDKWTIWSLDRTAWTQRVGAIRNLAIDSSGFVYQHDLDTSLVAPWLPSGLGPIPGFDPLSDITPFSWSMQTNLVTTDSPEVEAYHITRYLMDNMPTPAPGYDTDTFRIDMLGYGQESMDSDIFADFQDITQGQTTADFRVGGKAIQVLLSGTGGTMWRFGASSAHRGRDGQR